MDSVKRTFKPKTRQQLKESIEKCLKEGLMPILQAGTQVRGHSLLEAKELKTKEVAFINVEKLQKKKEDQKIPKVIKESLDHLLKSLQNRVGRKPKFFFEEFQNWAENQTSFVISCCPETKEEMSRVIKAAADESVVIRCAGARHSWAPVFADTCQVCVNIKNLKSDYSSLTNIRIADIERRTVDVTAGVTTGDLKTFQLQTTLNLNANVILDLVQMVSVAQTGCHGVGKDTHCLSDYLVKMRVFDSNGELRTYSLEEDKDLFQAVSAAFGCFGIVYDVTFKMDPEIIVETTTSYPRMHEIFCNEDKLREIVENNWAVEMFWFPFNSCPFDTTNDEIWVRTFNKKTNLEGNEKLEDVKFYETKDVYDYISQEALSIVSPFITADESLVPLIQWISFQSIRYIFYPSRKIYQEIPNAIHFRKYLDLAEVYDMEFVFDYKGDYRRLKKIIIVVVDVVKQFKAKSQYPLNVSLEMRFMTSSDAFLGTGNIANPRYGGSGHVVCIEVLSLKGTKNWEEFSTAVGKEWIALGGVPHLAKQYDHLPDIFEYTKQKMSQPIADFKDNLKKSGVDPSLYLNTGMRKLLGYE